MVGRLNGGQIGIRIRDVARCLRPNQINRLRIHSEPHLPAFLLSYTLLSRHLGSLAWKVFEREAGLPGSIPVSQVDPIRHRRMSTFVQAEKQGVLG